MFSFSNLDGVLESAKEIGLNKIRCNLTGKVIGTLDDSAIEAVIQFECFADPYMSPEDVLDSMLLRTLILNSRPAPHLTAHKNKDGMQFLRAFYPTDLFAMLASRMLFDNKINRDMKDSSELRQVRMQWLIECQDFFNENQELPAIESHVDALIRLDAIHDVRSVFYSPEVKAKAKHYIGESFDYAALVEFIHEVEDDAFEALSGRKIRTEGNPMSLSAALVAMSPEQLDLYEREEREEDSKRRAAIAKIQAGSRKGGSGKVTVRRIKLEDVALPKELAERYAAEGKLNLKEHKDKQKDAVSGVSKPTRRNKSAARFGNLSDINFDLL